MAASLSLVHLSLSRVGVLPSGALATDRESSGLPPLGLSSLRLMLSFDLVPW